MIKEAQNTKNEITLSLPTEERIFSQWNIILTSIIFLVAYLTLSSSFSHFEAKDANTGLFLFALSIFCSTAMSFGLKNQILLKIFFVISLLLYTLALTSLILVGAVGPGFILFIIFIFVIYYVILLENRFSY